MFGNLDLANVFLVLLGCSSNGFTRTAIHQDGTHMQALHANVPGTQIVVNSSLSWLAHLFVTQLSMLSPFYESEGD